MLTKEHKSLHLSLLLPAPLTRVWQVWTQPDEIKNWWGPDGFTNDIRKMDLQKDGEWILTMKGPDGKTFPNKSIFREILPNKKVVLEHFNPAYLATVTFEPKGNQTQMEWTMEFPTVELYDVVVKTFKADEGFRQSGEKLIAYLKT